MKIKELAAITEDNTFTDDHADYLYSLPIYRGVPSKVEEFAASLKRRPACYSSHKTLDDNWPAFIEDETVIGDIQNQIFDQLSSKLMSAIQIPVTVHKELAAKLNRNDVYQVTLDGKTRRCTFEKWHGVHALFYDNVDDWRFCIYIGHLRKVVKRVRNIEPDCGGCHAADCTQCN